MVNCQISGARLLSELMEHILDCFLGNRNGKRSISYRFPQPCLHHTIGAAFPYPGPQQDHCRIPHTVLKPLHNLKAHQTLLRSATRIKCQGRSFDCCCMWLLTHNSVHSWSQSKITKLSLSTCNTSDLINQSTGHLCSHARAFPAYSRFLPISVFR